MAEKDLIKLVYNVSIKGAEKLTSVYFNDKSIHLLEERLNIDEALKELSLNKLDLVILEKRPSLAIISQGHFKLVQDIGENINDVVGGHYFKYERSA